MLKQLLLILPIVCLAYACNDASDTPIDDGGVQAPSCQAQQGTCWLSCNPSSEYDEAYEAHHLALENAGKEGVDPEKAQEDIIKTQFTLYEACYNPCYRAYCECLGVNADWCQTYPKADTAN